MAELLTTEGKEALRKTIRRLRERLIVAIRDSASAEYQLDIASDKSRLTRAQAARRSRLEDWAEEQSRTEWVKGKKPTEKVLKALRERHIEQAAKEAAHTLLNRLVILRILEAGGLSKPVVLTGGWESQGYSEFAAFASALCAADAEGSRGYSSLLQLIFDELAVELPGVFGKVGLTSLFPIPAATLREVVEALNDSALDPAWRDDTTLGWVYQFWNDPAREALDDKISGGGKIEPHEIASKTQMFTERYMVEWLLQNSLGQTWLAMCKKHDWTPDFEQVREGLDQRRVDWRNKREAGEVEADALMPIQSELEHQWKYWVPQPMPEDAPDAAPASLRELKLLDPACGSGHFLVIAFDLLGALYREEARHRGRQIGDAEIAQSIVENNLHGIDIDPRAIQIAAAAVWLKSKLFCKDISITRMNLVAPTFKLAALPADDRALVELQKRLKVEVGIPDELTSSLVSALSGVDHLGTLLRVDKSVRKALKSYEKEFFGLRKGSQMNLLGEEDVKSRLQLSLDDAEASVMEQLANFLDAHEGESDLGLRLEGEQLAAGVRFLQIAQEGSFDVVVGNPPYQGTSKMAEAAWFKKHYPRSKADLSACFLERGMELLKPGGHTGLLVKRSWMFLSDYKVLRPELLAGYRLALLGDVDRGAFDAIRDEVVSVVMTILTNASSGMNGLAMQPTLPDDHSRDAGRTPRKRAAVLAQVGRFEFDVVKLSGIEGTPLVYWWDEEFLEDYVKAPKLGEVAKVCQGISTTDDTCFLRSPWEVAPMNFLHTQSPWRPLIKGARWDHWVEPLAYLISFGRAGLQVRTKEGMAFRNPDTHFELGVAFSAIGAAFRARRHRFPSVCHNMGSSVFRASLGGVLCNLNADATQLIASSLNPGLHFEIGDAKVLPLTERGSAQTISVAVAAAFTQHELSRESSVEFKQPGRSPWRYAQEWAQSAVDRLRGEPLPSYEEELDDPEPASFVSYAIGVALGRFGEGGEGILDLDLDPSTAAESELTQAESRALSSASTATQAGAQDTNSGLEVPNIEPSPLPEGQELLPDGILFVSAAPSVADSTKNAAFERVEQAWSQHSTAITDGKKASLNEWLRKDFFGYHKSLYENRPIYFPLSSEKKNFVAWVSIHRWEDNTLQSLLANYLHPARQKLEGEINDLNEARAGTDKKQKLAADKQYATSQKLFDELEQFIADVTLVAEKGAPNRQGEGAPFCPEREVDAPFKMDLDDGVMINSAAIWPLLLPQWKDPKKWWKELCSAQGRKDYDWAHLSKRYFPARVDAKCKEDPSLGVAHGCFWKYHPAKAYAWELRLQDEIAPDFTIDELDSKACRIAFLRDNPKDVAEIEAKEEQRRERNRKKAEKEAADEAVGDDTKFELRN